MTLFDFTADDAPADWRSIDDVVMGGVSESTFEATDAGATFRGTVSLEQGGGFASVRAPDRARDLSAHTAFQLRLRGDEQAYWWTAYTGPNSPSYRARLHPTPDWATVTVPFDALTPYHRGTHVPDAPPFDPASVYSVGFLIADEQDGPFGLEVAWIRAVDAPAAA
jgi:monofunctional biosynthetic peptidoglycan transglycosylase